MKGSVVGTDGRYRDQEASCTSIIFHVGKEISDLQEFCGGLLLKLLRRERHYA
jgi:hypothetical protein